MNKKMAGVIMGLVLSGAVVGSAQEGRDPAVGWAGMAGMDHLTAWTGKVETAMISSTHPKNGNMDFANFHGKYRGEKILFEHQGPGCVYRVWSAQPKGTIKFYLDGADQPALQCDFKEWLKQGRCDGLPSFHVGRDAEYLPVCFEKNIRLTARGFNLMAYYQISYQLYDPSVPVKSFAPGADLGDPKGLAQARAFWDSNGESSEEMQRPLLVEESKVSIPAGKKQVLQSLPGAGVVREMSLNDGEDAGRNLTELWLIISTDGRAEPDLLVPADAFFADKFETRNEWPNHEWKSVALEAGPQGFTSRWPMPFAQGMKIEIENRGKQDRAVFCRTSREEMNKLPAGTMRFRALYREQDYEAKVTRKTAFGTFHPVDPATNYVVLDRTGRGHYVGCILYVKSLGPIWWGEGDENTWVDKTDWPPQIQGTGTEDEFNWSWGFKNNLSSVSGVLKSTPKGVKKDETAENVVFRWRISDYVPFQKSIKVSYERVASLPPNYRYPGSLVNMTHNRGDDYASVAFWYELMPTAP